MKPKFISALILIFLSMGICAQELIPDSTSQAELAKIQFMEGKWKGSGWTLGRDGLKHEFEQTENVRMKLDATIMLIEGLGISKGVVSHNALAVISFNKEKGHYNFQSWLSNGRGGVFKGEVKDNTFYWYPNEYIRYIIYINDNGQWYEKGEMNRGGNWTQFFEMTLDKEK